MLEAQAAPSAARGKSKEEKNQRMIRGKYLGGRVQNNREEKVI